MSRNDEFDPRDVAAFEDPYDNTAVLSGGGQSIVDITQLDTNIGELLERHTLDQQTPLDLDAIADGDAVLVALHTGFGPLLAHSIGTHAVALLAPLRRVDHRRIHELPLHDFVALPPVISPTNAPTGQHLLEQHFTPDCEPASEDIVRLPLASQIEILQIMLATFVVLNYLDNGETGPR